MVSDHQVTRFYLCSFVAFVFYLRANLHLDTALGSGIQANLGEIISGHVGLEPTKNRMTHRVLDRKYLEPIDTCKSSHKCIISLEASQKQGEGLRLPSSQKNCIA